MPRLNIFYQSKGFIHDSSYNPANIAKHILVQKHVGEVKQEKNKKINAKLMKLKLSTNKFVKITKSTVV